MALSGQKARSSFTPTDASLDPDLWLTSRDVKVFTTTRFHPTGMPTGRWQEILTFDDDAPKERKVTSVIIDRQTGKVVHATDEFQTNATAAAKLAIGRP